MQYNYGFEGGREGIIDRIGRLGDKSLEWPSQCSPVVTLLLAALTKLPDRLRFALRGRSLLLDRLESIPAVVLGQTPLDIVRDLISYLKPDVRCCA